MLQPDRPQIKVRRMCIEYWITKATDTHSEYIILIIFPGNIGYANTPQYYVYTHIACLVISTLRWALALKVIGSKCAKKLFVGKTTIGRPKL
jgi:hypothetical protein